MSYWFNYTILSLKHFEPFYICVQNGQGTKHASEMTCFYLKQEEKNMREQMSGVCKAQGGKQTTGEITMATADGLGSWTANFLPVQRGFLEATGARTKG